MLSGNTLFNNRSSKAFFALWIIVLLASCTIVKNYPAGKPFVYETNIKLKGNFSNEERDNLISGLSDQLDDSMQSRKLDKLLYSVMKTPPAYDSSNADKSIIFMRALLGSQGYFNDTITYASKIKKRNFFESIFKKEYHPQRTVIDFTVTPGKQVKLDSIVYNMRYAPLQKIADSTIKQASIKKGGPFAKAPISAEFDRLTELYRNSGYLRFNRDEMVGIWDTLDVALLQPTLDPFEQLEILQKLQERREKPTANLEIRLRTVDTARLTKYYVGNVSVYPDFTTDTLGLTRKEKIIDGIKVVQFNNKFKPKIFPDNIYLPRGSVYQLRRYLSTINRFSALGTWRLVTIDQKPRDNQDTVDFIIKLIPAKKFSFNTNLEGSINQSAISGNLFGIGVNVGLQNRNFSRGANIASSNLRYGVELGNTGSSQFIQTQQASFSHNIYFPRLIPYLKFIPANLRDNFRTLFSFNAANTERRLLFNLTTINGAWGYEFQRRNVRKNTNMLLTVKIPNIEYSYLLQRDSLKNLIDSVPSLRNIFTDGFISSIITNFSLSGGSANRPNVLRINLEEAGLLTGLIRNSFLDKHLYRFIKLDVEFARLVKYNKSSLAVRAFGGVGYEFNSTRNPDKRNNLPFFKQYFSGGPNSMRAWALRRLGPGSSIKSFSQNPDRYGDIQLEANAEYRFPIGRPFGIKINGALFTDVGNVWFMKNAADRPAEEVFNITRFWKDIAVGAGAGLRVDFSFFVIRFDYAYKVKDPSPSPANAALQNKWFGYSFFNGAQFQLGIGYPFIF